MVGKPKVELTCSLSVGLNSGKPVGMFTNRQ